MHVCDARPRKRVGILTASVCVVFFFIFVFLCVKDPDKLSSVLVADAMESTYFVPETMSVWNVLEEVNKLVFDLHQSIFDPNRSIDRSIDRLDRAEVAHNLCNYRS